MVHQHSTGLQKRSLQYSQSMFLDYSIHRDKYQDRTSFSLCGNRDSSLYTLQNCCFFSLLILAYKYEPQVGVQTSKVEMLPSEEEIYSWGTFNEDLSPLDESAAFTTSGLMDQINATRDASDYLWYTTR